MGRHLNIELQRLKKRLLALSALAEDSVRLGVQAVHHRDESLAGQVIQMDHEIDLKEVEIEEECLKILALHQPVANDLRFVISALKINNDLERIGDLAVNIAERAVLLCKERPIPSPYDFLDMSEKTREMLRKSLDSLINSSVPEAEAVCGADEAVDEINRNVYDKVSARIREKPDDVTALILYLSVSRQLERIADYATNIAEDVIYLIEGKIIRHNLIQLPITPTQRR